MADKSKVRARLRQKVGAHFHEGRELGPGQVIEVRERDVHKGGGLENKFDPVGSTRSTSYPSRRTSSQKGE